MWFVYVGVGLLLVIASGLYVRRRIAGALTLFGVRPRRVRIVRWAIAWLLFGFPIIVVVSIVTSLLLDTSTLPRFDGFAASVLLAVPFMWAVLVVLQSLPWCVVTTTEAPPGILARTRRHAVMIQRVRVPSR